MLDKFRTLLGNTLIYGLGNYGVKIIGFLLIPLYTRYLTPSDYGIIALVAMRARNPRGRPADVGAGGAYVAVMRHLPSGSPGPRWNGGRAPSRR